MAKISYKIDRLINKSLELGLRTGAIITATSTDITTNKILKLNISDSELEAYVKKLSEDSTGTYKSNLVPKLYVDNSLDLYKTNIMNYLGDSYIKGGKYIAITQNEKSSTDPEKKVPDYTIDLEPVYTDNLTEENGEEIRIFTDNVKTEGQTAQSIKFITGIKLNKYGVLKGIDTKEISTSDLTDQDTYDNYKQWKLTVGSNPSTSFEIGSSLIEGNKALTLNPSNGVTLVGSAEDSSVTFGIALPAENERTITLNSNGNLTLESIREAKTNTGIIKNLSVDIYGRTTSEEVAVAGDLDDLITVFDGSKKGLVSSKSEANAIANEAAEALDPKALFFLDHEAKWVSLPYNKVTVANLQKGKTEKYYSILGSATNTAGLNTTVKLDAVQFSDNGAIKATKFIGDGSALTDLDPAHIKGTIADTQLSTIMQEQVIPEGKKLHELVNSSNNFTGDVIYLGSDKNYHVTAEVNTESLTESGDFILTRHYTDKDKTLNIPSWVSIKDVINRTVGDGGLRFVSTITSKADIDRYEFIKGDFFKATLASNASFKLGNHKIRNGDSIFALKDKDSAYSSAGDAEITNYFGVLESNIENPLTYSSESTALANVALIDATSGAVIHSSIVSIKKEESNTKAIIQNANLAGNADTADALTGQVKIFGEDYTITKSARDISKTIHNDKIVPVTSAGSSLGEKDNHFATAFIDSITAESVTATNFTGLASEASKVTNKITFIVPGKENVEYDGSQTDVSIDLTAKSLGVLTSVSLGTASGNGNFIKNFAINADPSDSTKIVVTPTFGDALTDITSDIFNITGSSTSKSIGYFKSYLNHDADPIFYLPTAIDENLPKGIKYLGLNSKLVAETIYVLNKADGSTYSNTKVKLAQNRKYSLDNKPTPKTILVADTDVGDNEYGFKSSDTEIVTTISKDETKNNNSSIPTTAAVNTYVKNTEVVKYETGSIYMEVTTDSAPYKSSLALPIGYAIDHVDVTILTPYVKSDKGDPGLSIRVGNSMELLNPDEIDITMENGTVFSYKIAKKIPAGSSGNVYATISNAKSGKVGISIYFAKATADQTV